MLTAITYNCDPESLGDVTQADFFEAFVNEVRFKPKYRNLNVEVCFIPGDSGLRIIASDDWEADISHDAEFFEDFERIAERAFEFCLLAK